MHVSKDERWGVCCVRVWVMALTDSPDTRPVQSAFSVVYGHIMSGLWWRKCSEDISVIDMLKSANNKQITSQNIRAPTSSPWRHRHHRAYTLAFIYREGLGPRMCFFLRPTCRRAVSVGAVVEPFVSAFGLFSYLKRRNNVELRRCRGMERHMACVHWLYSMRDRVGVRCFKPFFCEAMVSGIVAVGDCTHEYKCDLRTHIIAITHVEIELMVIQSFQLCAEALSKTTD